MGYSTVVIFIATRSKMSLYGCLVLGSLSCLSIALPHDFWIISVDLLETTLTSDCFTSCDRPQLRLSLQNLTKDLERSINFDIDKSRRNLRFANPEPWVVVLNSETGRNVTLKSVLIGDDPVYKFARICDKGSKTKFRLSSARTVDLRSQNELLLQGECFNVSVRLSLEKCGPQLCMTRDNGSDFESLCCSMDPKKPAKTSLIQRAAMNFSGTVPVWLAVILSLVILALLLVCITLLGAYANLRTHGRALPCLNGKSARQKSYDSTLRNPPSVCRSGSQDSGKYDVPWEQKFRPLPDYVRELTLHHQNGNGRPNNGANVNSLPDSGAESA